MFATFPPVLYLRCDFQNLPLSPTVSKSGTELSLIIHCSNSSELIGIESAASSQVVKHIFRQITHCSSSFVDWKSWI